VLPGRRAGSQVITVPKFNRQSGYTGAPSTEKTGAGKYGKRKMGSRDPPVLEKTVFSLGVASGSGE
jgi:hypothetical protein